MKLTLTTLALTVFAGARVATSTTHVYLHDLHGANSLASAPRDISPAAARLVLAQRRGVEEYHADDLENDEVIEAINDFGLRRKLFGSGGGEALVLIAEGDMAGGQSLGRRLREPGERADSESGPLTLDLPYFTISPAPSGNSTHALFLDLARQAAPRDLHLESASDKLVDEHLRGGIETADGGLQILMNVAEDLEGLLRTAKARNIHTITSIVTSPDGDHADSNAQAWGTYEMPGLQSLLRKRQPRAQVMEEDRATASSSASSDSTASSNTGISQASPLPGIIPACFPSESTCKSNTRECTGHGSCQLKYTDPTAKDGSPAKHCYACVCAATTSSNGKSTTFWGGGACQKKDVSVEFWLLALFSIGMVFLISFVIGQIWSMGQEELPSVIGAGVSGPARRS